MTTGYIAPAGDLDALFKARTSSAIADTGFKSNGGVDLAQRFEPRGSSTARANTNFKAGANDLSQLFMDISVFVPVTNTYNTGTAATETVPAGAVSCVITIWGPGGGGSREAGGNGDSWGGNSGAYSTRTVAVTGGQTFTYTVGQGGAGRTATSGSGSPGTAATTVSSASPSVSMSAGLGLGGVQGGPAGAAATASGGTTNTSGAQGLNPSGGSAPNGGNGGTTFGTAGSAPGGGGAGGSLTPGNGGNGAAGRISFAYT